MGDIGPPWKVGKCEGCGHEVEAAPGQSYRASTDGKVWHLGCAHSTFVPSLDSEVRGIAEDDRYSNEMVGIAVRNWFHRQQMKNQTRSSSEDSSHESA